MKGRVKWWNSEKGYGFIGGDDGKDIFCHYTAVQMKGRRDLKEAQRVDYSIESSEKGPRAANVQIMEDEK